MELGIIGLMSQSALVEQQLARRRLEEDLAARIAVLYGERAALLQSSLVLQRFRGQLRPGGPWPA